jgi:hypothetical protein
VTGSSRRVLDLAVSEAELLETRVAQRVAWNRRAASSTVVRSRRPRDDLVIPHVQLPGRPPFGQERSAFARGPKERELRVVIDRATAPPGDALELLLGFGHHPLIDLLSTRDEGLPYFGIGPIDQQEDLAPVMISRPDGSLMDTGVWPAGQWQEFAQRYLRERPDLGDYDEILRALLLGAASEDYGADALVTASPVLIDPAIRGSVARDSNAMPVEAALALVGLYLRTRDDFTVRQVQGARQRLDRGLFYWVLARELLPNAWRSIFAGGQHNEATGDDTVFQLFSSAIIRLDRALRARDRLHHQMKLEQNLDAADEALFFLDTFLVFLVGAFDAIGRAAHLTYGLKRNKLRDASWQRRWRIRQLAPEAPTLAQLMDDGTPTRDALDLLLLLRNTVHGEALTTVATRRASRPLENVLLLPKDQEQDLLDIIARRGGDDAWGIRQLCGLGVSMRIDMFVESVLPMASDALDRLIGAVEVERLPGVKAASLPSGPPADKPNGPLGDPIHSVRRRQVRLLAGL